MDKTVALREARDSLGQIVDAAHYGDENTVITKNGHPRAVVVSFDWYQQLADALGRAGAAAGAEPYPPSSDTIRHGAAEPGG